MQTGGDFRDAGGIHADPAAESILGPQVLLAATSYPSEGPFIALILLGFVVGTAGHIYKSKTTVAIGIGMIFLATVVLPLLLFSQQ